MAAPHLPGAGPGREKSALRQRMRLLRAAQDQAAAEAVVALVLEHLTLAPGSAVAGVWPLGDEMDLRPLWHALHRRGHRMLLPQTPPRGQTLIFRAWHPDSVMLPERFGTCYPDGPVGNPALIFVPLLAFDRAGHRLGYGGGYYDRTLAAHPDVLAVGFGFAAQEIHHVPVEEHDRRLDAVVTETGIIQFTQKKKAVLF